MQSNAIKLATFAVAVLSLVNQAFVFMGYVPPVPLDKLLHLTTEQLTIAFSFAVAFLPEVHKLGADVLAMLGGIINRDSAQANARYEALAQDFAALRGELDKLKAPPAQSGRAMVGYLLGLIVLMAVGLAAIAALPGCASTNPVASHASPLSVACEAYATALDKLTPIKAQLTAAQVAAINRTEPEAQAVCSGAEPADASTALKKVADALAATQSLAAQVDANNKQLSDIAAKLPVPASAASR